MTDAEVLTQAVIILANHGVEPDVQEMLLHGGGRGKVSPGALKAVVKMAIMEGVKRGKDSAEYNQ